MHIDQNINSLREKIQLMIKQFQQLKKENKELKTELLNMKSVLEKKDEILHSMEQKIDALKLNISSLTSDEKQALIALLMLAPTITQLGCVMPIYSSSPDIRAKELVYVSESFRVIPEIWERIWFLDTPDFETPYRTHGGVI